MFDAAFGKLAFDASCVKYQANTHQARHAPKTNVLGKLPLLLTKQARYLIFFENKQASRKATTQENSTEIGHISCISRVLRNREERKLSSKYQITSLVRSGERTYV